ncbi:hypothetical protein PSENEW3_00000421 [Picochlorum sp. SENEW3]|nr:hypothetical protein PSENEW3_00000421 [Picochlorum sp. SENEW3]
MTDSTNLAGKPIAKAKTRKLNAHAAGEEDECSSSIVDNRGFSNVQGASGMYWHPILAREGYGAETQSREEVARERNRLAQKRFRARQKEKREKQMQEIKGKEQERVVLLSEQKDIVTTMKVNSQLLSVRESLFRLYRTDECGALANGPAGPSTDARCFSSLPASLGGNMASIVLQSGQSHLASAMTGQIENAEYTAQFVSDSEEKRYFSLLSSAEEVQREFEKRASAVDVMLQRAVERGRMEALVALRGDRDFVSAQQKLFAFLWGMFCVNPSLALVWFSENSTIDEHKYAQAAKMLHGKLCPDGLERLRKLHSAQSLEYEKRQARLELLMAKVKKALDSVSSSPEYSSSTGVSMFVTLQECTDAICEVAKEEFSSMAPFSIAFLSEFDLIDLSVLTCYMSPQIMDSYAMASAVLREDLCQKSLK